LLFIVPLRIGGGTRLKILEAMALGIPTVSTSIGCEGIEAENDKEIIIADDPQGLQSIRKS
jgi:glycosyltransferase involved in cell wall biosynthesis